MTREDIALPYPGCLWGCWGGIIIVLCVFMALIPLCVPAAFVSEFCRAFMVDC